MRERNREKETERKKTETETDRQTDDKKGEQGGMEEERIRVLFK